MINKFFAGKYMIPDVHYTYDDAPVEYIKNKRGIDKNILMQAVKSSNYNISSTALQSPDADDVVLHHAIHYGTNRALELVDVQHKMNPQSQIDLVDRELPYYQVSSSFMKSMLFFSTMAKNTDNHEVLHHIAKVVPELTHATIRIIQQHKAFSPEIKKTLNTRIDNEVKYDDEKAGYRRILNGESR